MFQTNNCSSFTCQCNFAYTRNIPTQVKYIGSVRESFHLLCWDQFSINDRYQALRYYLCRRGCNINNLFPASIHYHCIIPISELPVSIILFPRINAVKKKGSQGSLPAPVSADSLLCSIGEGYAQVH